MLHAYALGAVLQMAADGDERAPGAAVTAALCGSWEHEGPCPVAPHRSVALRHGDTVELRIVYACPPGAEQAVRSTIRAALSSAHLEHPVGRTTTWQVSSCSQEDLLPAERPFADRLTGLP